MSLSSLSLTLSPLDNRYYKDVMPLIPYFSYQAWIKYRVLVEVCYLSMLRETLNEINISEEKISEWNNIMNDFGEQEVNEILEIEKTTHHDIKAIEIWLRKQYQKLEIGDPKYIEFIHFGLTSQDINSVAFSLQFKNSIEFFLTDELKKVCTKISNLGDEWIDIPMLALTHGQPAVPTTLGKEFRVFVTRLFFNVGELRRAKYITKFGGAVGNLNAHYATYPDLDWENIMNTFINKLNLARWDYTTQITNYDDIAHICNILKQINMVLIDLCQDIWLYVSRNYFNIRKENPDQVGSSTMPQKVNPINFENAEGNLKMANCGLSFIAEKLPVSRLQRDLTDSTVLRNIGTYLGHIAVALNNIMKGLNKLSPNLEIISTDLEKHPEILGEAVQCIFRKYGVSNGYNIVRMATQNIKFKSEESFLVKILEVCRRENVPNDAIKDIQVLVVNKYIGKVKK